MEVFYATGFLVLLKAEMVVQSVWTSRPGRLGALDITILSLTGGNFWMLRA